MRVLILSNFYPPHWVGGYELGCKQVADELASRGHSLKVITSCYVTVHAEESSTSGYEVIRKLKHTFNRGGGQRRGDGARAIWRDYRNRQLVREAIEVFDPQIIFLWNPMFLTPGVPLECELSGRPCLYYVSDQWPKHWQGSINPDWRRLEALSRLPLVAHALPQVLPSHHSKKYVDFPRLSCALFASQFLLDATPVSLYEKLDWSVLHWGVSPPNTPRQRSWVERPLKILFSGQFGEHKGLQTLLAALALVRERRGDGHIRLTIAGDALNISDRQRIEQLTADFKLEGVLTFTGRLSQVDLWDAYRNHHVYVFPSIWEEPFSIGLIEAFASGLAIISTTTGGSAEIVRHDVNALSFAAGVAEDCADKIVRLLDSPQLCERLAAKAVEDVSLLTIKNMVDVIEGKLKLIAGQKFVGH